MRIIHGDSDIEKTQSGYTATIPTRRGEVVVLALGIRLNIIIRPQNMNGFTKFSRLDNGNKVCFDRNIPSHPRTFLDPSAWSARLEPP